MADRDDEKLKIVHPAVEFEPRKPVPAPGQSPWAPVDETPKWLKDARENPNMPFSEPWKEKNEEKFVAAEERYKANPEAASTPVRLAHQFTEAGERFENDKEAQARLQKKVDTVGTAVALVPYMAADAAIRGGMEVSKRVRDYQIRKHRIEQQNQRLAELDKALDDPRALKIRQPLEEQSIDLDEGEPVDLDAVQVTEEDRQRAREAARKAAK